MKAQYEIFNEGQTWKQSDADKAANIEDQQNDKEQFKP